MRLQCGVLLLLATSLAACKSRQAIVPADAEAAVRKLYAQVIAQNSVGLLNEADALILSPFLSEGLTGKIHSASACMSNWYAKRPGADAETEVSWTHLRLFIGEDFSGDKRAEPKSFKIEKTEVERDGSILVYARIARKSTPDYTPTDPVAVVVIREGGRYVVDDVVYMSDHWRWMDDHTQQTYATEDARLSQYLSVGCGTPAKLVQAVYNQALARRSDEAQGHEDWSVFAPYLSRRLQHRISVAKACSEDWERENPYPPLKATFASKNLFLNDDEVNSGWSHFELQRDERQQDGSLRMYVRLMPRKPYEYSERVAPILIQEGGRFVVDDVAYIRDADWDDYPTGKPPDSLLSEHLAAGCDGTHWIRNSLPNEPMALAQSLYTQITLRKPLGVPTGTSWKVVAPYLGKSLLRKVDDYQACMSDWGRQNPEDPANPVKLPGLGEDGLFSGGNEMADPASFQVENVQKEGDGRVRVYVKLTWHDWTYRNDTLTWRVADVLRREHNRWVLNDVVFLKDKLLNISYDHTLTRELSMSGECAGRRWMGYR